MNLTIDELLGEGWDDDVEIEVEPDPYKFKRLTATEWAVIDQLLPIGEVALLLGLSRQRVDQLMAPNGPLPVVWIGKVRFVLRRDVARYAEVHGLPRLAPRRKWKRIDLSAQPPTNDDA